MNSFTVLKQNPEMITRTIDGYAVIMDPQEGKILTLNEVGTRIWELAEVHSTKEDIVAAICREFQIDREQAAADMEEFSQTLLHKRLLLLEEYSNDIR